MALPDSSWGMEPPAGALAQPTGRLLSSTAAHELQVLPVLPPTQQPDKFSVHLVVRAPNGAAFRGSQDVGQAVGMMR